MNPLVLISNDDGYQAKGINELVRMVRHLGDIIVCAPDGGRSGKSRAFSTETLTLHKLSDEPTPGTPYHVEVWKCSGTPVDCIKIAYAEICPKTPDLVLGGINHGDNASTNAHYSGTVGVAIEGAMKGIPSIAYSLCNHDPKANFLPMENLIRELTAQILEQGLPHYTCLNVNVPVTDNLQGVKVCRMAHGRWHNEVDKRRHPNGMSDYYWMTGFYVNDEPEAEDTDNWALSHDFAAITPITVELTAPEYKDARYQQFCNIKI